jgi:quinol monooxygenase YgiN
MTYAYSATFRAQQGNRDQVVEILTRPGSAMAESGCLLYEVGGGDDVDVIHVIELWESAEAHSASLQLDSVRAAIAEVLPMLTPDISGVGFEVVGSPLRYGSQ